MIFDDTSFAPNEYNPPIYHSLLPPATSSLLFFASAQRMVLRMGPPDRGDECGMVSLFEESHSSSGKPPFPLLHSLRVVWCKYAEGLSLPGSVRATFIHPLLSLPSLHTLILSTQPSASLDWTAFRLLLSLPVTHLNLSASDVTVPVSIDEFIAGGIATNLPISSTWSVLQLPYIHDGVLGQAEVMEAMLQNYVSGESGVRTGKLRYLEVPRADSDEAMACFSKLCTLLSLDMSFEEQSVHLEPLYTTPLQRPPHPRCIASRSPRLTPLHLHYRCRCFATLM